jgi:hypothetical protein
MKTQKEGVTTIFNRDGDLVAIIYKDMKSRKNVFYSVAEMGMEELETLVGSDKVAPVSTENQ